MATAASESVTFWLQRWHDGADGALEQITRLVYDDLRRLAASYLRDERRDHTLQATALVHEVYLRISSVQEVDWKARGQFMSIAAQMMRRILIDHARRRHAAKRDGGSVAQPRREEMLPGPDLLDMNRALNRLESDYPRHARIVELRFFGGLGAPEIAQALDLSLRTVERDWQFAKAWLQDEISRF